MSINRVVNAPTLHFAVNRVFVVISQDGNEIARTPEVKGTWLTTLQHTMTVGLQPTKPLDFDLYVRGVWDSGSTVGRATMEPRDLEDALQQKRASTHLLTLAMCSTEATLEITVFDGELDGVPVGALPGSPGSPGDPGVPGSAPPGDPGSPGVPDVTASETQAFKQPDGLNFVFQRVADARAAEFTFEQLIAGLPRAGGIPDAHIGMHEALSQVFTSRTHIGANLTWALAAFNARTLRYTEGMEFGDSLPAALREECSKMRKDLAASVVGGDRLPDTEVIYAAIDTLLYHSESGCLLHAPLLMHAFQAGKYKFASMLDTTVPFDYPFHAASSAWYNENYVHDLLKVSKEILRELRLRPGLLATASTQDLHS